MDLSLLLEDSQEISVSLGLVKESDDSREYALVDHQNHQYLRFLLKGGQVNILYRDNSVAEEEAELNAKLDELAVQIFESLQSGVEESETETAEENPYNPEAIRVEAKTFSLRQIYDMIKEGDIDLSPDFQRRFVWDTRRKSRLIESILLRIPLPMFYFSQDEDGRISVVDGVQRLTSIRDFMENEFKLRDLEYLKNCEGRYYATEELRDLAVIDAKYFRYFNMTQITVNVIDPSSPAKVKYDIFRRINTGGKPLNAQEIRNCLASEKLRELLREMTSLPAFLAATGGSVKDVRMEAQELALRFILFLRLYESDPTLENYSGKVENELDSLVDDLNAELKSGEVDYLKAFENAMLNASYLFDSYAFRKIKAEHIRDGARKQLINKALFVSWSVLLARFEPSIVSRRVDQGCFAEILAKRITNDTDLFLFLTYSTNAKANIQHAFRAASNMIADAKL
jgi:hypothetical protein